MIMIRTDANEKIATGHMMRCITIANECLNRGIQVCFVFADHISEELFKKLSPNHNEYQVEILNSSYNKPDTELKTLINIIKKTSPISILIDSYFMTPSYLNELTKISRTFYIDDIYAFDYPVDVVINYCINAIYANKNNKGKRYLLSPYYAPIRPEFRNIPYKVKEKVKDILITTGGTDEAGISLQIIDAARNALPDTAGLHIVIGAINRNREQLLKLSLTDSKIKTYENVTDMAGLMQKCDLAISTAGSTIYELCAIGVPTICFTIAENQVPNASGLSKANVVIYAHDKQFAAHISELAANYNRRKILSANMRNLVDGFGASRIADELV